MTIPIYNFNNTTNGSVMNSLVEASNTVLAARDDLPSVYINGTLVGTRYGASNGRNWVLHKVKDNTNPQVGTYAFFTPSPSPIKAGLGSPVWLKLKPTTTTKNKWGDIDSKFEQSFASAEEMQAAQGTPEPPPEAPKEDSGAELPPLTVGERADRQLTILYQGPLGPFGGKPYTCKDAEGRYYTFWAKDELGGAGATANVRGTVEGTKSVRNPANPSSYVTAWVLKRVTGVKKGVPEQPENEAGQPEGSPEATPGTPTPGAGNGEGAAGEAGEEGPPEATPQEKQVTLEELKEYAASLQSDKEASEAEKNNIYAQIKALIDRYISEGRISHTNLTPERLMDEAQFKTHLSAIEYKRKLGNKAKAEGKQTYTPDSYSYYDLPYDYRQTGPMVHKSEMSPQEYEQKAMMLFDQFEALLHSLKDDGLLARYQSNEDPNAYSNLPEQTLNTRIRLWSGGLPEDVKNTSLGKLTAADLKTEDAIDTIVGKFISEIEEARAAGARGEQQLKTPQDAYFSSHIERPFTPAEYVDALDNEELALYELKGEADNKFKALYDSVTAKDKELEKMIDETNAKISSMTPRTYTPAPFRPRKRYRRWGGVEDWVRQNCKFAKKS